jgi:transcriptional regulator with XRE-family HTH domain
MLQTIIGDKLRHFRTLRKMTQEQVSDELGLSESAYNKYETGESELTVSRLAEIAEIFKVKPHEILLYEKQQDAATAQIINTNNHIESSTQTVNYHPPLLNKPAALRKQIEVLESEIELLRKRIADLEEINQFLREKK